MISFTIKNISDTHFGKVTQSGDEYNEKILFKITNNKGGIRKYINLVNEIVTNPRLKEFLLRNKIKRKHFKGTEISYTYKYNNSKIEVAMYNKNNTTSILYSFFMPVSIEGMMDDKDIKTEAILLYIKTMLDAISILPNISLYLEENKINIDSSFDCFVSSYEKDNRIKREMELLNDEQIFDVEDASERFRKKAFIKLMAIESLLARREDAVNYQKECVKNKILCATYKKYCGLSCDFEQKEMESNLNLLLVQAINVNIPGHQGILQEILIDIARKRMVR